MLYKFDILYNRYQNKKYDTTLGKMIGNDYPIIDFDEASRKWRKIK